MSLPQAIIIGKAADKISREITRSHEVSAARSAIATGTGAALGAAASGALVVTGIAAAPVTVPLTLAAGGFALLCSLFE